MATCLHMELRALYFFEGHSGVLPIIPLFLFFFCSEHITVVKDPLCMDAELGLSMYTYVQFF